jgi:hypothetical protein
MVTFVDFTVDNLDNIYISTAVTSLRNIIQNGDSVAVFNDVKEIRAGFIH